MRFQKHVPSLHSVRIIMVSEEIHFHFVFIAHIIVRWTRCAFFFCSSIHFESSPIRSDFWSINFPSLRFLVPIFLFLWIAFQLLFSLRNSSHCSFRVFIIFLLNMVNPLANHDDAYYLHPSHNPGLILVSQLLTHDNFNSWQRAMLMAWSMPSPAITHQFHESIFIGVWILTTHK